MKIVSIDHVQLAMPPGGEDHARVFYHSLLGIPEVPKPPAQAARGGCWFEDGELKVHLGIQEDFVPATKAHPAFLVEDVIGLMTKCTEAGYETVRGEALDGYLRGYVYDPFGNRIELLEPTTS